MARSSAPGQTAVDYVTIVLSPALITGLVGSLVLFLLEVFYRGDESGQDWKQRLQWILSFYVLGAVLVSRISMMSEIASRFWIYGSILALLTYVGLQGFVAYPHGVREVSFLINGVLVAVVWWCAHRLTWDCTNVDEEADVSGEGVLQAAGLAASESDEGKAAAQPEEPKTLWQRWKEYKERRAKRRTLGVWVVYFSLAALPIFGLGQSLIPLTDPDRRAFTFWLMTIYVGCGLGLLLTTCFLGLRRYLRKKRLQMPAAMTGAWLTMGGLLIAVLLLAGALIPRPYQERPIADLVDPAGAKKREANRFAPKGDSPGEGKGQAGEKHDPNAKDAGKTGEQGKDAGKDKGKGEKGQGQDKDGKGGSDSARDKGKDGGEKGKDGGEKGKAQPKDGEQGNQKDGGKGGKQEEAAKGMKEMEKGQQNNTSSALSGVQQFLQRVGPWLKWIVFGLIAVLVAVALFRGGLGWLANFSTWAKGLLDAWRKFWAGLFGAKKEEAEAGDEAAAAEVDPLAPFSSYANPFESGRAEQMSMRQLVRYSFAALEAWAREHGVPRRPDETALEFAARLGGEFPALEAEAGRLAQLHARAEYASAELPAGAAQALRAFWDKLDRVAAAPLSA